jgi:hypothetical protein
MLKSLKKAIDDLKKVVQPHAVKASDAARLRDYASGMSYELMLEAEVRRLSNSFINQLAAKQKKQRR